MNVNEWLVESTSLLNKAGVGTARLDALVLLEDATEKDRAWLLARPETTLTSKQLNKLTNLLKLRATHKPLAYIRGRTEFYGREFVVNESVLEPRPESETMINLLKELLSKPHAGHKTLSGLAIADIGTGSGAIGITAMLELPGTHIDLIDIDQNALDVAKINVDKFTISTNTVLSDLLDKTTVDYDILLCNLPYVPDDFKINLAASHEPRIAIFGGLDGLDLYRKLFKQLAIRTSEVLYILCESMPPQHEALQSIAKQNSYKLLIENDFIQVFTCSK